MSRLLSHGENCPDGCQVVKIVYLWLSDGDGCLSVVQLSCLGPTVSEGLGRKTSVTVEIVQIASYGSSLGCDIMQIVPDSTIIRQMLHQTYIWYMLCGMVWYAMVYFLYAMVLYGIL